MTNLVIDGSVSMAWWFDDEYDAYAEKVLDFLDEATAIVPAVWPLEVTNALLIGERRGRISPDDSGRVTELITELPIVVDEETHVRAMGAIMALGRNFRLTAYDASYLELAMRLGIPLATSDRALVQAARASGTALWRAA